MGSSVKSFARLAIASLSAAIVALVATLAVTFIVLAAYAVTNASLDGIAVAEMGAGALLGSAISQILKWSAFWFLTSCVAYPLVHLGLSWHGYSSRRAYELMGVSAPLLFMLVIEALSLQFAPFDFVQIAVCGGIPAAFVFRELAGVGANRSQNIGLATIGNTPRHALLGRVIVACALI